MQNGPLKRTSSDSGKQSRLIQLFAQRVGNCKSPEKAIISAVTALRRTNRRGGTAEQRLRFYLKSRRIQSVRLELNLDCDGALRPIGSEYSDGFQMVVSKNISSARFRFTIAHEICHTFFYEYVPEFKFFPHRTDDLEERLCDLGAAELLMPAIAIQKSAPLLAVCIESLCTLATEFSVSVAAMFLRLRTLHLWNCVLSEWHQMTDGSFVLVKFYGGKAKPWEWEDESILDSAWYSYKPIFGNTVVRYNDDLGHRFYYPARFEIRRIGNRLLALWGSQVENSIPQYPLLEKCE
jgi:IrrE N-terminal-like domain